MSSGKIHAELRERRLSDIQAADVAGYSRLMGADEVGTAAVDAVRCAVSLYRSACTVFRGKARRDCG